MINDAPSVPLRDLDNAPKGLVARINSSRPGDSLSITCSVPSGVRSRGANPVPPVVTMSPANPWLIVNRAAATELTPSGTTRRSST